MRWQRADRLHVGDSPLRSGRLGNRIERLGRECSSVYEFAAGTSGKATPLSTISGSATLLNSPVGLASDVLPRARPEPGLISRRFRGVLTLRFVPINRPPLIHAIGEAAVTKRAGG
jgi:hypothetical protein